MIGAFRDFLRMVMGWWSGTTAAPAAPTRFGTWSDPVRTATWSDPDRTAEWSDPARTATWSD